MVPKLRFPNFSMPWISKTLGDVFEITSGSTPSRSNLNYFKNGHISWVKTTDLNNGLIQSTQEKVTENAIAETSSLKILPKGTVFVAMYGGFNQIGRTGMLLDDAACNQALSAIKPNKKNSDPYFLLSYLNFKVDAWKLFAASSRKDPNITKKDVSNFTFIHPCIEEQIKIADFLSSIDEKITLLSKQYELLCHYKKGIMRKVFTQEVRFKDENGEAFPEWNPCQLKDVATRVIRKNKENNQTILTISGRDGLVDQMTYFNKQIASKNVTGYYLINNGEFAYNKSYSQGYPMGAIKMLTNYNKGVVSTLYICFKLNENQANNFYRHYFESGLQNRSIEKVAQEGARNHGLLNIGVNDFFDIELQTPSLKEQIKIADFFSALDDKISVKKAELYMLKTWKQGLLQQMFV